MRWQETMMMRFLISILFATVTSTFAQQGDRPGELQPLRVPRDKIPPAPPLTPDLALRTFAVAPGFGIELVASEPLIEAPVAALFDPDGRLWVLEMRSFMPNLAGVGEHEPKGRISILEDTNQDGRMDRSKVFLDRLVMPRAIALVRGGLLVAEPPNLWFCRDTNHDDRADERHLVASDYAIEADPKLGSRANPEHAANGLLWAMDNWIYSANFTTRFRNTAGQWQRDSAPFRGQWGITQDNYGRLFYNSNSDHLRGDLVPAHYLARNPAYRAMGVNVPIAKDQTVWPGRVNPGVNRGYEPDTLRANGTLVRFTGACGPVIYRGDQFPPECVGDAFVCEPTANLVRRSILVEHDAAITATNAYLKQEFLTSFDERFRPVNLSNGPDGALYIVDMYRGMIQHRIYLTSYLRQQYQERNLDGPLNLGRIYRVYHQPKPPKRPHQPQLSRARSAELVELLSHPNGWWRDTAQRLLVERADLSAVPQLRQTALNGTNPLAQLHALWTLDGLAQSDAQVLLHTLAAPNPKVRAAAVRLCEPLLGTSNRAQLFARISELVSDPAPEVRLQVALTVGELKNKETTQLLARLLDENASHPLIRDAVLSGLHGRTLPFLEHLLSQPSWAENRPGRPEALSALSQALFANRQEPEVRHLLNLIAEENSTPAWRPVAMLDGILRSLPRSLPGRPAAPVRPIQLAAAPPGLTALYGSEVADVRDRAQQLDPLLVWPGKETAKPRSVQPLTEQQLARFHTGKDLYIATCGACHQPHGNGQEGLAPPLVDSEWVLGPEARLVRLALHGVRGPITVKGKMYQMEMPPLGVLDDEQIASILTYVRREWGHTSSPVDPETVARIRKETENRDEAWTETELLTIP